jgi:3-phosphoshikimate 1-carboxyvinyltransferase
MQLKLNETFNYKAISRMKASIGLNNQLNGTITASPSKSYTHRAFIAASLAEGVSVISNPLISGDIDVTLTFLKKLGINISQASVNSYLVKGLGGIYKEIKEILDCKNSGTTLRIFSALALILKKGLRFKGDFLIKERPILPLLNALGLLGAKWKLKNGILSVKRIKKSCVDIEIGGDISSQFITALLMVCPILKCQTQNISIKITKPITSYPYVKITLEVLKHFGINIQERITDQKMGCYLISTGQKYRGQRITIPGDFSSISYIIASVILSKNDSKVIISNLDFKNPQGDKIIIEILQKMGAQLAKDEVKGELIITGNIHEFPLVGIEIDVKDTPDLFPLLAVIGAFAEGKTTLYNAAVLRFKESDRISTISRELKRMGVHVEESPDRLIISHCDNIMGIKVNHDNDHRIAMALLIATLYANTRSEIENIEVVKDSYPKFLSDLVKLGAQIELK